jgi:hypothetical protein
VKKIRAWLVTLLLGALVIRELWVAVAPLIPYIICALFVVAVLGLLYYRSRKW